MMQFNMQAGVTGGRTKGFSAKQVVLRMPRALRSASVDGKEWGNFKGEEITLPEGDSINIRGEFL
jgi:hypothetical protein